MFISVVCACTHRWRWQWWWLSKYTHPWYISICMWHAYTYDFTFLVCISIGYLQPRHPGSRYIFFHDPYWFDYTCAQEGRVYLKESVIFYVEGHYKLVYLLCFFIQQRKEFFLSLSLHFCLGVFMHSIMLYGEILSACDTWTLSYAMLC